MHRIKRKLHRKMTHHPANTRQSTYPLCSLFPACMGLLCDSCLRIRRPCTSLDDRRMCTRARSECDALLLYEQIRYDQFNLVDVPASRDGVLTAIPRWYIINKSSTMISSQYCSSSAFGSFGPSVSMLRIMLSTRKLYACQQELRVHKGAQTYRTAGGRLGKEKESAPVEYEALKALEAAENLRSRLSRALDI